MPQVPVIEQKKKFRSLRTIILAVTFIGLAFFLLTLISELIVAVRTQQQVIVNEQRLIAQSAGDTVKSFSEEKLRIVDQAADLNSLATKTERRALVTEKLLGRNPDFRQMFLLDEQGTELYKASRLSLLTPDPISQFKEPLLADTQEGKRYISPVYIDSATNEPLVLIAVPANDIFHTPKGAYVAEVNLKFMWDLVASIKVGKGGAAYVVDRQGNLLAYKDVSLILARKNVSDIPIVHTFVSAGPAVVSDDFNALAKGITGTWVTSSHAHLGSPDWAVIIETPILEAYRPIIDVLIPSVLLILLAIVVFSFITFRAVPMIITPILKLSNAAQEMSAGNFHTRVAFSSENELGQLADSFNVMAGNLEGLYKSLDAKVQEKTAELEHKLTELKTMNELMVDRELKMIELKKEIELLKAQVLPSAAPRS